MPLNVEINKVPQLVQLCKKSKNNLLIIGDPGVGKSQTILSLANEHCKVTMMTGSSTYEETANGIPRDNKAENIQDYTRPAWFVDMLEWAAKHTDQEDYQVLFIDEFNTADPQVLKTFLSILSERKIPTQKESLPENVVMVAAMNPCNQNEGEELIRPMASRFVTVEIKNSKDDYANYISGETEKSLAGFFDLLEDAEEISLEIKNGYLDQVVDGDWSKFEPGTYHEINPRSMSNFFRALGFLKNKKKDSPSLSMAMLGRTYSYPTPEEVKEAQKAKRQEKVKSGSVLPTKEELQEMSTEDLKKLRESMLSLGSKGANVLAQILEILISRGETI